MQMHRLPVWKTIGFTAISCSSSSDKGNLHIYHYRAHDTRKGVFNEPISYRFQPKCHADIYFYARTGDFHHADSGDAFHAEKEEGMRQTLFHLGADEPHSMCCASDLDHNDKGIWSAAGIFIPYQFCPAPVSAAVDHPDC